MTTLENRPNSALVVIDVQNCVVADAYDRDAIVARVAAVVEKARAAGTDVVWVQDEDEDHPRGSEAWQLVPEVSRDDADPLVHKSYGDAFEDTELESVLAERGVGHLFVAGAQTDACIRSTLHGAITRGYDATLIADAHTTEDHSPYGAPSPDLVIAHTNLYWGYQDAPGRRGGTVTSGEVDFSSRPHPAR